MKATAEMSQVDIEQTKKKVSLKLIKRGQKNK